MSTLVSSFVQDRASAAQLPTASLISGALKGWVLFQGAGSPIGNLRSLNVASIGDGGVGTYTVNLTAALTGYSIPAVSAAGGVGYPSSHGAASFGILSVAVLTNALQDANVDVHVAGDLA